MKSKSQEPNNKSQKFLEKIIAKKTKEFVRTTQKTQKPSMSDFQIVGISDIPSNQSFLKIFDLENKKKIGLIAEVKFASPTNPHLGSPDDLLQRVEQYDQAGAGAISFITEKHYFKGDTRFIPQIKKAVDLPILQKDFIIDEQQIYEAKQIGSDALLLIARLVDKETLKQFVDLCLELHVEPVVEINSDDDLKKAVATKTNIIAVNARDLETFEIDVKKACLLMRKIPDRFIKLGFSGIQSVKEVLQYKNAGANGVLVGTSLMQAKDIKMFVKSLQVLPEAPSRRTHQDGQVQVKICATRSIEAAQIAVDNGAEFLGLVFTPLIKTHTVDRKVAAQIGKEMKGKIQLVGVFQNMPLEEVQAIIAECNLDYAQFHGDETPEYINQIKIKIIKAFRFPGVVNLKQARKQMKQYTVDYYLVDRIKQSEGPILDLNIVSILAKEFPLVFAGGLNTENVTDVIKIVKPKMVDVASGVETNGQQDMKKIKQFIKNAKGVTI